jgi:hypothetical protein
VLVVGNSSQISKQLCVFASATWKRVAHVCGSGELCGVIARGMEFLGDKRRFVLSGSAHYFCRLGSSA